MAQRIERAVPIEPNPFERVVASHRRPGYSVEPAAIAWHAVAFKLRGRRDAIACIPRAALDQFLDDLDAGRLDEPICRFLASPASGRVLRAAEQTDKPRLFDTLASPDAIVPPERPPGRPGLRGRGGGGPTGSRRDKRSRRPRPRRVLIAGAVTAAALAVAGVIAAAGQNDEKEPTAVAAGGSPLPGQADPLLPVPIEGATSPPKAGDLPKGAILHQGGSGTEIGCIPCDGAFRIMSIDGPGVTLSGAGGPEEAALLSAPLTADGVITRLGARLSSADGGNWTLNVRCRITDVPGSCGTPSDATVNARSGETGFALACSVPVGATTCVRWDPEEGREVKAGDQLALAVGNPGEPCTQGHFTMEWWFVFEPN